MSTEPGDTAAESLLVDGRTHLELPWGVTPERVELPFVRKSFGFECTSGDRKEGEWTGIPVLDLLDAAGVPDDTTHVQFESVDGNCTCVPLTDLDEALVALGDGDDQPRFVSSAVSGPRTLKRLAEIRPVSLAAGEDRELYEDLPDDE
jgi:DMSO/TMAO reductase YedYZ molybdopterin-dependent catalytic subunit